MQETLLSDPMTMKRKYDSTDHLRVQLPGPGGPVFRLKFAE
jgi:hypothetical protein